MKMNWQERIAGCKKGQKGTILAMTALISMALLASAGLAVDISHLYLASSELQNAADMAAISGASGLNGYASGITEAVDRAVTSMNKYEFDNTDVTINRSDVRFAVNLSAFNGEGDGVGEEAARANPANIRFVKVTLPPHAVKVLFIKPFINAEMRNLSKTAVAGLAITSEADKECDNGPNTICDWAPLAVVQDPATQAPLGLQGSCPRTDIFHPGCTYIMRSGPGGQGNGGVSPGNYQILCATDNNCGGSDTRASLAEGVKNCLHPGDTVATNPGVTARPVRQGLNTRFGDASTSDAPADTNVKEGITYAEYKSGLPQYTEAPPVGVIARADRRILILPIVNLNEFDNGRGAVRIYTFAAFFMRNRVAGGNGGDIAAEYIGTNVFAGAPKWESNFVQPEDTSVIKFISTPVLHQ